MKLDNGLIDEAIKDIKKERMLQGRILESVSKGDYAQAKYLTDAYKDAANDTDRTTFQIVNTCKDCTMEQVAGYIRDYLKDKTNSKEDMDLGLCLSMLIGREVIAVASHGSFNETMSYNEEVYMMAHSMLVDKYLEADKESTKNRLLSNICLNIFRSDGLRGMFRGNTALSERYNPDLYFGKDAHNLIGRAIYTRQLMQSCSILAKNTMASTFLVAAKMFAGADTNKDLKIVLSVDESEIIDIAAVYACARARDIAIQLPVNDFDDVTIEKIKKAAELGEAYAKKQGKVKEK
jgi:hypothetical protein